MFEIARSLPWLELLELDRRQRPIASFQAKNRVGLVNVVK